jgi:hypothetical protein
MEEAQQAHYFGLPPDLALASVTSVPAEAAGLAHRIGILREGADADIVLWDSHPLQLAATPTKVWIDGVLQIPLPRKEGDRSGDVIVGKGKEAPAWRKVPEVPNWDKERKEALEWEGLPPLDGRKDSGRVVFHNVKELWTRTPDGFVAKALTSTDDQMVMVVVEHGKIVCAGHGSTCTPIAAAEPRKMVDLHAGSISPGFMAFGGRIGLEEIEEESSTGDGVFPDAFMGDIPRVFGDAGGVVRAVDALQFGTRNAL